MSRGIVSSLAMRFIASLLLACALLGGGYAGLRNANAAVDPARIIMYQGRLLNSNNVPLSDATANMTFALYDAASAGNCLWSNNSETCASIVQRSVTLTAGLFSEALGTGTYAAIGPTVFSNNAGVYLEVTVNGETLTPRKQMLAAPYAINSDFLDGYTTAVGGATVSAIPVLDPNGNLIITGAPQGSGVGQGSLYINPASGVVAANEILLGGAVGGVTRFSVDAEGDTIIGGNVGISGTSINGTGALQVVSGGSGALTFSSGSGIVSTVNSFSVGANALAAAFSVDSSTGTIRIGNGSVNPTINFYANDGTTTGQVTYNTGDSLILSDMGFNQTGLGTLPSGSNGTFINFVTSQTISGTSGSNLQALKNFNFHSSLAYSAVEGSGTTSHEVNAAQNSLNISGGTSTITFGSGVKGSIFNSSTNGSLIQSGGFLSGVVGLSTQNAAATTVSDLRGVYGETIATNGTITNAYGVYGTIANGGGTVTSGYGMFARNTGAGTNRYGLFAEASGGTSNFSGYFTGASVQIDADTSPDSPSIASASGELYVSGDFEHRGSGRFGDTTGVDEFLFTSQATNISALVVSANALTSGKGIFVQRNDDATGTAFTGNLVEINQSDVTSSTGATLSVKNAAGGNSFAGYFVQNITADQTNGAGGTAVGGQALVLETPETGSNDDIMLVRSNGQLVLAIETDGSVLSDNAYSSGGADYAEYFPTADSSLAFYEVVCVDSTQPFSVKRCEAGNPGPFGVMSSDPGFIGNLPPNGESGNALVGMVGQIETRVNASEGAIAVGDPIATSHTLAGYGAKANGPARILGFALESLSSGSGTIKVLVQPQWYAGDVLTRSGNATQVAGSFAVAATTAATSTVTAVNSASLELRGSAWNGTSAQTQGMSLRTTVNAVDDYRLSVANQDGVEVASVNRAGDLSLAGRFYPSDRGAMQESAYIYYDGSAGIGGSFMRTNASGWATGSYDFAEMFPSSDALTPGELVVFGDASQHVKRSVGETYSRTIAGIVSTRPGFLAGENRPGNYPIALAGRVPTFVSSENGQIRIGDPLTTSSRPGYAMKATEPGPIVGYAAEEFTGSAGSIVVYVNVSYYSGAPIETGPATANSISHLAQDIENFDTTGVLNFNGGQLLAIGSMAGMNGTWRLETDGDVITSGRLVQLVQSASGTQVETYAATTREMTVQLSGTIEIMNGRATVVFDDIDPSFTSIIDVNPSYRALVTPYGATGSLYVTNRTVDGFEIVESGAASSNVSVDWIVLAYRRDYAPAPASSEENLTIPTLPSSGSDAVPPTGSEDSSSSGGEEPIGEMNETPDDSTDVPAGSDVSTEVVVREEENTVAPETDSSNNAGETSPSPESQSGGAESSGASGESSVAGGDSGVGDAGGATP